LLAKIAVYIMISAGHPAELFVSFLRKEDGKISHLLRPQQSLVLSAKLCVNHVPGAYLIQTLDCNLQQSDTCSNICQVVVTHEKIAL